MPNSDTSNPNRLREILQEPWNNANQNLNKILFVVFQVKYQSGGNSPAFELHSTIISSYMIVAVIYCFACTFCSGQILPSSMEEHCFPVLNAIVFLAGSLATTLLVIAILPVFGLVVFVVWAIVCGIMTWRVRAEIYALIRLVIVNVKSLRNRFLSPDGPSPV